MISPPRDRIMGIETEFGTLVMDPDLGKSEHVVAAIVDHVFRKQKLGLIDQHSRDDVFEPAYSGGFLMNGSRLYIDAVGSHLEYATAECRSIPEAVAHDRAGHRIITRAIEELQLQNVVAVYNNSVDHFGGHTFGSHENYLTLISDDFYSERMDRLLPFLVSRQVFAGVGRVGGHLLMADVRRPNREEVIENPIDYIWVSQIYGVVPDPDVEFQLSQRADHILKAAASRVRFNRAIVNPKWENMYSHDRWQRLHLLYGESNQNEFAFALKIGTTRIVLQMIEDGLVPEDWILEHPIHALRAISRDPSLQVKVNWYDGSSSTALEMQARYCELAQAYRGESDEVDWVLTEWERILSDLATDPETCGDRIDWVAKRTIMRGYIEENKSNWFDDALHSIDLEYHNVDPKQSLFGALTDMGQVRRVTNELQISEAMVEPPANTRAHGRGALVRHVLKNKVKPYVFDWSGVILGRSEYVDMPDPFHSYSECSSIAED